jgi:hypothetical protein
MGGESCHYTHLTVHCLPSITLEGGYDKASIPQSRGFGITRSTSTRPRPNLDAQHSSTGKEGRYGTAFWVILSSHPLRHHGVQGWPTVPRARRYSHLNRDRQNITSGLPGVPASSYPIKGQARALQQRQKTTSNRPHTSPKPSAEHSKAPQQRSTSQAIISVLFFLSLRLGFVALSRKLVTPTQAPRCKKIQNSHPPLDVGTSSARTRINPRVFSLHHYLG